MDDDSDPRMGRGQDPREQHPGGRGLLRIFKTGEPVPPSVGYFPDFGTWLEYGILLGFCSHVCCDVHDGMPLSEDEFQEIDEGSDICIPAVRIYPSGKQPACHE